MFCGVLFLVACILFYSACLGDDLFRMDGMCMVEWRLEVVII